MGGHVTGGALEGGDIVKGHGLDIRALLQDVQTVHHSLEGGSFQVCVAAFSAETGKPHRLGDLVHTVYGTIDFIVPDFQKVQHFFVAVQLAGHAVHAGTPVGIFATQDCGFWKIPV